MSGFNGLGQFFFTYNWVNDAANGIPITASRMDTQFNDAAQGFDNCITRDGQSPATADIPLGGFKLTGLGNPSVAGDALTFGAPATVTTLTATGAATAASLAVGGALQSGILLQASGDSGNATVTPIIARLRNTRNASGYSTTIPWASYQFYSDDASDAGVNIRGFVGAYDLDGFGGRTDVMIGATSSTDTSGAIPVLRISRQTSTVGPAQDNNYNLGAASFRWNTVFAVTGTINTSDENEKNWIGPLSSGEMAASKQILQEIGGFQFLSSISDKGPDAARVHVGVRAQKVHDILANNGLNPLRYAFLCFDEWAEKAAEPEVPAAAEIPEVRDEKTGEIVSEAIPAFTGRSSVPATQAGSRWGIRPDELAYFLMAGLGQRLSDLETN